MEGGDHTYIGIHLLDVSPATAEKAQKSLRSDGIYGLAFAEALAAPGHLPYAENVVNAVMLQAPGTAPLSEVFRILTPRGFLLVAPGAKLKPNKLKELILMCEDAGFTCIQQFWQNFNFIAFIAIKR